MPGNAKPGKIKSPGIAKPSDRIKTEDIKGKAQAEKSVEQKPRKSQKTEKIAQNNVKAVAPSKSAKTLKKSDGATAEKSVGTAKTVKQPEKSVKQSAKSKKADNLKSASKSATVKTEKTGAAQIEKPKTVKTVKSSLNDRAAKANKILPTPSAKEQKPSDKTVKAAVKQKENRSVKKSEEKASQISFFDPITFDRTVRDMEITYISLLSYVGKLYVGHFAKSGFGGGIDAVLSDVTDYIAHGLKELGQKGDRVMTERLCKTVFRSTGDGWKGGVPLALKITVAMDLHGGSKYTETLCSDIQRIYELAKIAGVTRSQAREMIGGLKTFAAGQGIDIK